MDNNNELIVGILEDFKVYNGLKGDDDDKLYKLYINKAIQTILNLTNRYKFPKELRYLVIDLINDFYMDKALKDQLTDNNATGKIQSISEAGRSVTFGNSSESTVSSLLTKYIDNQISLRLTEINRYRLLYKGVDKGEQQD